MNTIVEHVAPVSAHELNSFKRFRFWLKDRAPYIVVLSFILLFILVFLWSRVFIVIRPGEAGVLYRMLSSGTVTDHVYAEGLHIVLPLNTMYKYETRVQVAFHDISALTSSGLPIKLALAVRFQPIYELLGVLHQEVGPDYLNKIILPQIESVLRRNIGQYTPEDIYTNREGVLSRVITLALEEVGRKYIQVDDIIIRSVDLPDTVKISIENKLVNEQQFLAYNFRLKTEEEEAKRKKIEAEGQDTYQQIVGASLTDKLLQWHGIQATQELAKSPNAKVVVIGSGKNGLPLILNDGGVQNTTPAIK
ncbi:prohibitin family protein [Propionivibrio sp.]|uniref:prohibitin family protein n=1 Tax=Propionivibrio sp. TaxID=2212460 RepID=UPI003BEFE512